MFGIKVGKKSARSCAVCGNGVEENAQVSDLCNNCFQRCVLLSKQLEYLQNTSVANLNIIQKAAFTGVSVEGDAEICVSAVTAETEKEENGVCAENKKYFLYRKSTNEKREIGVQPLVIGSSGEKADIPIPENRTLSRMHAKIRLGEDGACYIEDLNSKNGVKVQGVRIAASEEYLLHDGDVVALASEVFRLIAE